MPIVHVCTIGRDMANATWGSSYLHLYEACVLTCAQHLGEDDSRVLIHGMPAPSLLGLLPHNTPHVVNGSVFHGGDFDEHLAGLQPLERDLGDVLKRRRLFLNAAMTVVGLRCSTRAISRIPLPWRVISRMCCVTAGMRRW
jgi:hypothetical protein